MGSILSFSLGSRRCALDNRWAVEVDTWRIQGTICGRYAYESLQVSSGMQGQKFGVCFNYSHYCVQCWVAILNLDATHRPHWYWSEVGGWIGSGTSHIGVHNSEGTLYSAPYLFESPFTNEWPAVAIQASAAWCFGDTLLSGTNSKRGKNYIEVFVTKFGWSRLFPMAKKGDAHEALSLLFQWYGLPPKIIFDSSKEQNLGKFES